MRSGDAELVPYERLEPPNDLPLTEMGPDTWKYVRDYRGDAWLWWATATHLLADPFLWPYACHAVVAQLTVTENPATWRGTHVAWIGK